ALGVALGDGLAQGDAEAARPPEAGADPARELVAPRLAALRQGPADQPDLPVEPGLVGAAGHADERRWGRRSRADAEPAPARRALAVAARDPLAFLVGLGRLALLALRLLGGDRLRDVLELALLGAHAEDELD